MALYLYETTDSAQPAERYEFRQSMLDEAYTHHPETGVPIQRIITGGYGLMARGSTRSPAPPAGGKTSCGSGCGCC